jgi:hypothetical protein
MTGESKHKHFCFAGQPAPCKGHFRNDVLPCICGVKGDVLTALNQLGIPALGSTLITAEPAPTRPVRVKDEAA